MTLFRRAIAALCILLVAAVPALADAPFTMTSTWQKIASAGATVDVQNTATPPVFLLTSASLPSGTAQGQILVKGDHRSYTLTADLYAFGVNGAQVFVTSGITAPSGGGGGGGGGPVSGTVSANQGTAGSTAWPVVDSALATAIASSTTPTSVKGSPTTQMLTTQEGNASLSLTAQSRTDTATPFFSQSLVTDGTPYTTVAVNVSAMGAGATLVLQGCDYNLANCQTLLTKATNVKNEYSAITATGLYTAAVPFPYVRLIQSAITSGTSTASAFFTKGPAPTGLVTAAQGNSSGVSPGWYSNENANGSAGGIFKFSRIVSSAATTNATLAQAGTSRLYKIVGCNTTTTPAYIHITNTASAPTPGTTNTYFSRPLPPSATAGVPACVSYDMMDIGWSFTTGIAYWLSTGNGDTDATALGAGQVTQLSFEFQ